MADFENEDHPHGMEPYDVATDSDMVLGALSKGQQEKLNAYKVKARTENEMYLRQHPEVECLLSGFLRSVIRKKTVGARTRVVGLINLIDLFLTQPDNIRQFAAEHFTDSELPVGIEKQLEERQRLLRENKVLQKLHPVSG